MSLADNKRSVFTTIGSYTSLLQEGTPPLQTDLYSSINNKNDSVPFLLDVLKTVAGSNALIETIGGMFTKLIDNAEPKLKVVLKKQFIHSNSNQTLPTTGTNFKANGIIVPVKSIDSNGKLKINPSSDDGNLIYGSTNSFDKTAYNAILNSGTFESYNNMSIKYIESSDSFQIKPNLGGSNPTIGEYFNDFIDNTELINKKELMSTVMDNFYGTLAKNQSKTVEQIYNELETETKLQQVLNDDNSYIILPEKYDELLNKAQEMAIGTVNYDLGCGLMQSKLNFNDFKNVINIISGSTDPFFIGNQIGNTIDKSSTGNSTTQNQTIENKQTIKDGFFQRIINIFTVKMLEALTISPQIRVLFAMISFLENGNTSLSTPNDDIHNFKTSINCISNEIRSMISEFIYTIVIAFLIKLLNPVIKKILKEKINQYVKIIKSLVSTNIE